MIFTLDMTRSDPTQDAAPVSATQRTYRLLRGKIISAEIPPGQRLKIDDLKTELQIGASPIREALSLLTSDQLVERYDQRGFRAAAASKDHFAEILRLRCKLDDIAIRDSIGAAGVEWEERLVLCHHRLSRADRGDPQTWESHHKTFHMTLLQECGSPILLKFCDQLYDLNIRYRYLAGQSASYGGRNIGQEHRQILAAALDRDADLAAHNLLQHYARTGAFLAERITSGERAAVKPAARY